MGHLFDGQRHREKIQNRTWNSEDAEECLAYFREKTSWQGEHKNLYLVSYGIFACSCRTYLMEMIEFCQKALDELQEESERALLYLSLMRLYSLLGFQPKIIEYGRRYADSRYADPETLKSVYNTIAVAFSEIGLFEESRYYLIRMLDITRQAKLPEDDFSAILNELVFDDNMVYLDIELKRFEGAWVHCRHAKELVEQRLPEEYRKQFRKQLVFTELYLNQITEGESAELADSFSREMRDLIEHGSQYHGISYVVQYFVCFLELLVHQKRYAEAVRFAEYITQSSEFTGSCSKLYQKLIQVAQESDEPSLKTKAAEWLQRYKEQLELEQQEYWQVRQILVQQEIRVMDLEKHLEVDDLTGCRNRRFLERKGQGELLRLGTGCLVFLDLDHLKKINDQEGHAAGDSYLRVFARNMQKLLKQEEMLYRYAGDEFIILSNQGRELVEERLEQLQTESRLTFFLRGHREQIGFSYGAADFPGEAEALEELISQADERMYLCKKRHHEREAGSIS